MNDTDVLVALEQALPGLRPAEQRIARAILESPSIVGDSTITQLAAACGSKWRVLTHTAEPAPGRLSVSTSSDRSGLQPGPVVFDPTGRRLL